MLSVVIPFHNPGEYLSQAVRSALTNGFEPLELILVDDGSSQNIRSEKGRIIRQSQAGPAAARNTGWKQASHGLVAFLDADDLWEPGSLARLTQALEREPTARIAQGKLRRQHLGLGPETGVRRQSTSPYYGVNVGACLFRREVLEQMGGFDESLRHGEDTDFFIRAWHLGVPKVRIPECVLVYQLHSDNMSLGGPSDQRTLATLALKQARRTRQGFPSRAEPGLVDYLGREEEFPATEASHALPGQSSGHRQRSD